jgi:hypothetical protein
MLPTAQTEKQQQGNKSTVQLELQIALCPPGRLLFIDAPEGDLPRRCILEAAPGQQFEPEIVLHPSLVEHHRLRNYRHAVLELMSQVE